MKHTTALSLFLWLPFPLLFSHSPPISPLSLLLPLQFPPLALTMRLWICSASILCSPIPFSYILHLFIQAHLIQSVPGVGRTSGTAGGIDAHWHTHYTAQGVPMVENGQVSFTMEISIKCIKQGAIRPWVSEITATTKQEGGYVWSLMAELSELLHVYNLLENILFLFDFFLWILSDY